MIVWSALFGIFVAFVGFWTALQDRARRKRAIDRAQSKLDTERPLKTGQD